MIHGYDVSNYQPEHFPVTGIDFAIVKVTEGLFYTNPKWVAQRDWARQNGLVVGYYHYPHMANSAKEEADFFLNKIAWRPGDIVVLDWEGYDSANRAVSKARQLVYRDEWLAYVKGKMPTHQVGMYSNIDYWTNVDKTSNCGDFLWIATGGRPAGEPGISYPWTFHQYSTANNIDHDVASFPTRAALKTWSLARETGGTDVALTDADAHKVWFADEIPAQEPPYNNPDYDTNKTWTAKYALYTSARAGRETLERVKAIEAKVEALSAGGVDLDALAVKVADEIYKRMAA